MSDLALAAQQAAQLNLLTRAKSGAKLDQNEIEQLQSIAAGEAQAPAAAAPSWPSQNACARALGLAAHRLRTLCKKGLPARAGEKIEQLAVYRWCHEHRAQLPEAETTDDLEKQLKVARLQLQNEKMRDAHIDSAARLATRHLEAARAGFRSRLSPHLVASLRDCDDASLVGQLDQLLDAAIANALKAD